MGVTREAGLSPQASPQEQDPREGSPAAWSRKAQVPSENQPSGCPAAPSGTETDFCRIPVKKEPTSSTCMEKTVRKTDDMTNFMDDLTLGSPKKTDSSVRAKRSCNRSSTRSSSRSSCSSQSSSSSSSSASSRSWSRSRSRSRSWGRSGTRWYRRSSRSYSRSWSRSRGYARYRGRYRSRVVCYRRCYRSPPRYRSRSRSWSRGRSYYRRSYSRSRSCSRGRRYYGFGRTIYPEAYRRRRSRSRTRSRSRSPLHLSEKEKRELLEIAKANAAKALGTDNVVLPLSLKVISPSKETNNEKTKCENLGEAAEQLGRVTEDVTKSGMERATPQRIISFSPKNTMAKPILQKPAGHAIKETVVSPGGDDNKKGSPYGQWVPIKKEENKFLNFSPKSVPFRAR